MIDSSNKAVKITTNQYDKLIERIGEQDKILISNSGKLDKVIAALLGDEYSTEDGLIKQVKKQEKRIKILEVIYIGGAAIITVGGVIISIINKLNI